MTVAEEGTGNIRPQTFEQAMAQEGFAGSGRPCQEGKTRIFLNGAQQACQGSFMSGGRIVARAIGSGRERPPRQAKIRQIHGPSPQVVSTKRPIFPIGTGGGMTLRNG